MAKRRRLTERQKERMRADLLERRRLLVADARELMKGIHADPSNRGGDEADQAQSSFAGEMAMGAAAREARELHLIEEALERMAKGTYGRCAECGGSISLPRLKALPVAEYCIDCQELLEEQGLASDPCGLRRR